MSDQVKTIEIEATVRTGLGKSYTRKLRRAGKIPAVLYDKGKSTVIELDPKLLPKAWTSNGRKFTLALNGKSRNVYMQELQLHVVKRTALHVDLVYAD